MRNSHFHRDLKAKAKFRYNFLNGIADGELPKVDELKKENNTNN